MKKIQKGDTVFVIAGKYKGTKSTIESMQGDRLIVKGVNVVKKAVKGQGFVEKTLSLHGSNVMLADSAGKPSRVGIKIDKKKKIRYYKTTGKAVLSPKKS